MNRFAAAFRELDVLYGEELFRISRRLAELGAVMKCMANGSIPATYSRYEYVSDKPK